MGRRASANVTLSTAPDADLASWGPAVTPPVSEPETLTCSLGRWAVPLSASLNDTASVPDAT